MRLQVWETGYLSTGTQAHPPAPPRPEAQARPSERAWGRPQTPPALQGPRAVAPRPGRVGVGAGGCWLQRFSGETCYLLLVSSVGSWGPEILVILGHLPLA